MTGLGRLLRAIGPWWNWKCAFLSSLLRGGVFVATTLPAGADAALAALANDLVFRGALAGVFGALIERLSTWPRRSLANAITLVVLPLAAHVVEVAVHWRRGTPRLGLALVASVSVTLVSTAFNLFAMRRRTFVVGGAARSLRADLSALPSLFGAFLMFPFRSWGRRGDR